MLVWKIAQFCLQNKTNQGQKIVTPLLNRVEKWAIFCLKQAKGLKASAVQLFPHFP